MDDEKIKNENIKQILKILKIIYQVSAKILKEVIKISTTRKI